MIFDSSPTSYKPLSEAKSVLSPPASPETMTGISKKNKETNCIAEKKNDAYIAAFSKASVFFKAIAINTTMIAQRIRASIRKCL